MNWVVMVQVFLSKQLMFSPSLVEKTCPTCPVLSLRVCVCGLLTSLGAVGKTSEHSSKQQSTDEDKSVGFFYDKPVFELVGGGDVETNCRLRLVLKPHAATRSNICLCLEAR